jgi:hypothetical protein
LFNFNDNRLELVKEYKYLGLTVTGKKARKAFFGLKAII